MTDLEFLVTTDAAYATFCAAEREWEAQLATMFGTNSPVARYTTAGEGEPGTPLRAAFDRVTEARNAYLAIVHTNRTPQERIVGAMARIEERLSWTEVEA